MIAEAILAVPPYEMTPLTQVEAARLLARCCGAKGDPLGACDALERAVCESRVMESAWMERKALEDMLEHVDGEAAVRGVRERIDRLHLGSNATRLASQTLTEGETG